MSYIEYKNTFSSIGNYNIFHSTLVNQYKKKYKTEYGCLYASSDVQSIEFIIQKAKEKLLLSPSFIIVIGIGGSYAGTKAVYDALFHDITRPLYFIDTFDEYEIQSITQQITKSAADKKNVICVVVSKSGTTLETVVNFKVLRDVFVNCYPKNWHELIVVISDESSTLTSWAKEHKCMTLSIPSLIGGRFSVFTAVGLFPLALAGIDLRALCDGASEYMDSALKNSENVSCKSASFIYGKYVHGYMIHDMFLFHKRFESLGKWYRQLCAESLGKEKKDGTKMNLLPTVSVGTIDLHSVTQLMLGAQPRVVTTFVGVQSASSNMNKAAYATQKSYEYVGLPYDTIHIPELTPYYIGQFMQIYILQVLYMAQISEVNPFDQPHVELYKNIMKQL